MIKKLDRTLTGWFIFWLFNAIAATLLIVMAGRLVLSPGLIDLAVYRAAGEAVIDGFPYLYAPDFGQQTGTFLPFTYPPIAALLSVPLALLPPGVDNVLWTLAGTLLLATYVYRRSGNLDVVRATGWAFVVAVCLWTLPVSDTLTLGQLGIFLTLGCIAGCASRFAAPAMLIGLFAAVKLTPLIFLIYFVVTGQWRRLAWASGAFVGLTLAGYCLLPDETSWFFTSLGNSAERVGDQAFYANQSIAGALRRLGIDNQIVWALLSCCVVVAGLWLARNWYLKGSLVGGAVVIGLTSVLVSPVSWQHHAVWVVPAALLAYSYAASTWEKIAIGVLFGVSLLRLPLWVSQWPSNKWLAVLGESLTLTVVGLLVVLWLLNRRESDREAVKS